MQIDMTLCLWIYCGLNILMHNLIAGATELKSGAHEVRKIYLKTICETSSHMK